jgi:autotransporter passenger strand-loop-strand repeat protein
MTTISVTNSHTSTVSSPIPGTTTYLVESGGTLDVLSGGVISGSITDSGTVNVSSGRTTEVTVFDEFGGMSVGSGATFSGYNDADGVVDGRRSRAFIRPMPMLGAGREVVS